MKFLRQLFLLCAVMLGALFPALADDNANAPVKVACVGDSITAGVGVRDKNKDSYPAVLARLLGAGFEVRNFGVSARTMLKKGDHPYWNENAFRDAQNWKPDRVVIMLGTNDSKHPTDALPNATNNWQYKDDFVSDYKEMVGAFKTANPAAKIYVAQPVPAFPGQWGINDDTIHNEIGPMVAQIAKDTGTILLDLYTPLNGKKEFFPDQVHPNEAGAKAMAEAVYQALSGKTAN